MMQFSALALEKAKVFERAFQLPSPRHNSFRLNSKCKHPNSSRFLKGAVSIWSNFSILEVAAELQTAENCSIVSIALITVDVKHH